MVAVRGWRRAAIAAVAVPVLLAGACSSASHPNAAPPTSRARVAGSAGEGRGPGGGGAGTTTTVAGPAPTLVATQEGWTLPAAVSRPVVLPAGAGFLILGGLATGDVSTSRIVRVDPSAGQAEVVGQLAVAVHDSAGAQLHGEWFVFGGGSYSTVAEVQAWTAGRATELATLPDARSDLTTAVVGGTAYIVGGFDGTTMTPDILSTTDGVTFRLAGRLTVPVRYAAVAAAGGYLWVVGGVTSTSEGGTAETDAVQRFDPATGQTTVVGRLAQAIGHATGITLNGTAYVVGGRSGTVPSAAIWRIDPARAALLPAGRLPQALSDAGSVVVGGAAYIVGGEVTGPTAPLSTVVVLRPHG